MNGKKCRYSEKSDYKTRLENTKIISSLIFKGKAEIVTVVNSSNKIVHELRLK